MEVHLESNLPPFYRGLTICDKHVHDEDLKNFIKSKGRQYGECSICGENYQDWSFDTPFLIDFETLFEFIKSSIESVYRDAWSVLIRDTEAEDFIGQYYKTREMLELVWLDCDDDFLELIVECFGEYEVWAELNEEEVEENEELFYSWNVFSDLVKNRIRYLFYDFDDQKPIRGFRKPVDILNEIGEYISSQKMFIIYPEFGDLFNQDPKIFRARQHKRKKEIKSYLDICSPPPEHAKSNRFSPEGISMFYGAECPITAIKEVLVKDKVNEYVSVAEFVQNRPLYFVDLRNPQLIGFFDEKNRKKRQASIFIKRFVDEITKPIDTFQKDSIEYIPSQIITEYFRYVLTKRGHRIDGIVYKSSKDPKKNCYVIFADSNSCTEEGRHHDNHLLLMKKGSIKSQKVRNFLLSSK